jgi:DNA polymerase I-like protein with 3'-5' exonuclease and polymerase domains
MLQQLKGNSMEEGIKKLQDTVRKLEKRVAKLEEASRSQQATREATAVNKAMKGSAASIRKLEED